MKRRLGDADRFEIRQQNADSTIVAFTYSCMRVIIRIASWRHENKKQVRQRGNTSGRVYLYYNFKREADAIFICPQLFHFQTQDRVPRS